MSCTTTVAERKRRSLPAERLVERYLRAQYPWVRRWGFERLPWMPEFGEQAARRGAKGYDILRYRPDFLCLSSSSCDLYEAKSAGRHLANLNVEAFEHQLRYYDNGHFFYAFVNTGRAVLRIVRADEVRALIVDKVIPERANRGSGRPFYVVELSGLKPITAL